MKILVTGGAGFIGSHVVDLLSKDHEVIVIDDLSNKSKKNLPPKTEFHNIKLPSSETEKVFREDIDIVIHMAANVFVTKSLNDPVFDANSNIIGSLNILENCRKYGVKKIIYSNSGGAISGEPEYLPVDENHPIKPISPYGISKYVVEKYLEMYAKLYGLKYTSLRYANVYGPRQNPNGEGGVVAIFINKLLKNESPFIIGTGKQTRDMVFVKDAAEANLLALKKGDNDCFNISTGKETSVKEIYEIIKKVTQSNIDPEFRPEIPGEIKRSVLSCKKAKAKLGWSPKTSLEQGIKETVEYYKNLL